MNLDLGLLVPQAFQDELERLRDMNSQRARVVWLAQEPTPELEAEAERILRASKPVTSDDPLRHHKDARLHGTFGGDKFGTQAEKFARFFGTPKYLVSQTVFVIFWIVLNIVGITHHWDAYPFILLNLLFSTQAAYAAPLILLAQTRQSDRDKATEKADATHRQEIAERQAQELDANTELTRQVHALLEQNTSLTEQVHALLSKEATAVSASTELMIEVRDRLRGLPGRTA
jgi:uncharacterized membrane protein